MSWQCYHTVDISGDPNDTPVRIVLRCMNAEDVVEMDYDGSQRITAKKWDYCGVWSIDMNVKDLEKAKDEARRLWSEYLPGTIKEIVIYELRDLPGSFNTILFQSDNFKHFDKRKITEPF
jgi:hypothetical protein